MVQIIFIAANGKRHEVAASVGATLMETAVNNMIDAIVAECGGCCSCATCHCVVDQAWAMKLPPIDDLENDMLEGVTDRKPNSRLSCQIFVTEEMEGMIVYLPESQY